MPSQIASGAFGRLGKAAGAIGLVVFAIAALLSGSDRQSRDLPNSPSLVGWPYDTGATRAKAILAFVQTGPTSAIRYARRSILSDPISAQSVSMLGRAQLYSGQLASAHKTFEVSGQLGWRDAMTQIYWLDEAMQANDFKVAAERLDALLRQSPQDENRDKFIALLSSVPEGRGALAERLKLSPDWAGSYATEVGDLPREQLLQRVDIMKRTGRGVWNCATTATLAQNLINDGMVDDAQSIWRQNCASSKSLIYDGEFDANDTTKQTTAFDWQLSNRGDVNIEIMRDTTGHRSLGLEVTAAMSLPVLRQLIVLKPGNYRLTWRTSGVGTNLSNALRVSLACKPDLAGALLGEQVRTDKEVFTQDFKIDAECAARQLTFWLMPRNKLQLDEVTLEML